MVDQESGNSSHTETRERLATGTTIAERYRIHEVVGEGGMGTVYAAEHLLLRKRVAIKVLHLELLKLPNIAARFEREAQAMARIEHPNATAALDFGRLGNGALYLVLEYVEGRRLREELASGRLSPKRAVDIAGQIAQVLVAAQSLNIVHRDLKPENIILTQRGDESDFVKVLDFGIARMTSPEDESGAAQPLTKVGAVFGTPEYMSPEQAMGQRVDARADLYSLGVILFEMLTGTRPYAQTGQTAILSQQLTSARPTLAERAPDLQVPEELERLVHRLLAKGVQERFQRAQDVAVALQAIGTSLEAQAPTSRIPATNTDEPLPSFPLTTKLTGLQAEASPVVDGSRRGEVARQLAQWMGRGRESLRSAGAVLATHADTLADAWVRRLPEQYRVRVARLPRSVSRGVLGGAFAILLALPVVGLVMVVRCSREPAAVSPAASAVPAVSASGVAMAAPSGSAPIVLDEKSKDPDVLLELGLERLRADKEAEAVSFVLRALGQQPERRNDERVAIVLFRAANSLQKDAADKSFSALQGIMAAKGAEILYQIWIDRSVREATRKRADRWIRSEAFDRAASGSISVAVKLRMADSCERKAALLPTAGKLGGTAVLSYLEELERTVGCGLGGGEDCYACLRKDNQLKDAIALVRVRIQTKH